MRWLTLLVAAVVLFAAAGGSATAAVSARAWGANSNGQLGDGTTQDRPAAVATRAPADVLSVAAGEAFSMAVTASGSVLAWGDNEFGNFGVQTPHPSEAVPVPVATLHGVKQIAAGFEDGVALLSDGTVVGWGANAHGAIGDGTTTPRRTPVAVPGLTRVVAIAQRQQHSLALLANGTVLTWGQAVGGDQLRPVPVSGLSGVVAIAAGGFHDLALRQDGTVVAWGSGGAGQLGDGNFSDQPAPVQVSGINDAVGIAAGAFFSLALLRDGTVAGWGSNQFNQLGAASTVNHDLPVPVRGVSDAMALTAGDTFAAAIQTSGDVLSWGANAHGALGQGTIGSTFSAVATPGRVVGLSHAAAVSAGGTHTLALTGSTAPPPPVFARSVDVSQVNGLVLIKRPGAVSGFVPLTSAAQVPVGSVVDTTRGTVALASATPRRKTQSGQFGGGLFTVRQSRRGGGLTDLGLIDANGGCRPRGAAVTARALPRRITGRLRARVRGRFRTSGRYSSATVHGTSWQMIDRCDGTLTIVQQGTVAVFDRRRRKSIIVRARHRYFAAA